MTLTLAVNVFDVWTFRRTPEGLRFLLLHTSVDKAERFFNGGRFWQIPSNLVKEGEHLTDAIARHLRSFGLKSQAIWAAEHTYTIYNRRFNEMQLIGVYAAEVNESAVRLNASEHAEFQWLTRGAMSGAACTSADSRTVCVPCRSTSRGPPRRRASCACIQRMRHEIHVCLSMPGLQ